MTNTVIKFFTSFHVIAATYAMFANNRDNVTTYINTFRYYKCYIEFGKKNKLFRIGKDKGLKIPKNNIPI